MTSNMTIENATLKVTGPITPYLSVTPNTPFTILPNRPYPVTLVMDSPTTATLNRPLHGEVGVYDATGRHYRFDLKVLAMWHRPPSTPTPTPTTTP
jgi:hypothetical protein